VLRRGSTDGTDPYVAAVPVLLALAAALLLIRLYPLPLRLLSRPASRLPGAVAHLGLARAGRAPVLARLPLLALLVALTVASVGGSVLAGVTAGRDRGALTEVGADARLNSLAPLPGDIAARLRGQVDGIRDTVAVRVEQDEDSPGEQLSYTLVVADPANYARLVRETGVGGSFPAAALAGGPRNGVLPAVVSPAVAGLFGSRVFTVPAQAGATPVRVAAVADATPAEPDADFVIVSTAAMERAHPSTERDLFAPTQLYVVGARLDGSRLTAAVRQDAAQAGDTQGITVTLRSRILAGFGTPLQAGARRVYLAAVSAAVGYSALALLLALLQAAPQRSSLLAGLRTMGMTRRQSRRLVLLEMMPQALLAAFGGVLVSLAAIGLLGHEVRLGVLAFGANTGDWPPGDGLVLRADPLSLALPAAGLLVLACAGLVAQVWWSGRRRESTELRVGDRV
jgi:putative ABC transport system permease protein